MDQVHSLVISRPDSIGDVVLTLPLAGRIKEAYPHIHVYFLGQPYTRAVIEQCSHVDAWIDADGLSRLPVPPDLLIHVLPRPSIAWDAVRMGVPWRVGTTRRLYHWLTCNRWVSLSRKNSSLHEAQLNLQLLAPLGIDTELSLDAIAGYYGLQPGDPLPADLQNRIDPQRYNLLLHPKSAGSAREWPLNRFGELVERLDPQRFNIMVTGTAKEKSLIQPFLDRYGDRIQDLTGLMDLRQLIRFIYEADGLLANSTGPLHLAAALGKQALGIYPPITPMHPGRWAPIGPHAKYFVEPIACEACRSQPASCACIQAIAPAPIIDTLQSYYAQKFAKPHG